MGSTDSFEVNLITPESLGSDMDDALFSDENPAAIPLNPFPDSTHILIGIYLVIIGLLGTFGNGLVLAMFIRFRTLLTPTAVLLVNLAISDLGVLVFGFPFSASSSFAKTWLFGEGGCQWYAFTGFLFGTAHIGTLGLLAVDRYLVTCKNAARDQLTYGRYYKLTVFIWIYAAFWAAMPLFGWARYGLEPSITTCTIDWRHNDFNYKSFMVCYFVLAFVVPLAAIVFSYSSIARKLKSQKTPALRAAIHDKWANEKNVTLMSLAVVIAFVVAWSPYAVLCVWTVFAEPSTVPAFLTLLPPLFAKGSLTFNPIIYYATNPRLRLGLMATLGCCPGNQGEILEMTSGDAREKEPVNTGNENNSN